MPPEPHIPLARYRDDPVAFVRDVLPDSGEPYEKQRETLELLAQERKTSVVGCYASGKDWTAARAILWWLETRAHAKVVVTGPTQRQIEEIVWREMRIAYKSASVPLSGKMLRNRYEIDDDRFAIGFSTNRPENLQGFHSPNMMVVVTEAHGMKPAFEEALKRLNPSKVLLVGNALSTSGEFYESHRALRSRYKRVKISAYDTPAFTGEPIEIYGLMNEEDIADREADTGRDHPLFMAGVLAEFPDAQDDSLTGRKAVDAAMADDAPSGEGAPTAEDDALQPVYIGVDVARFGYDKSALIARRGQRVIAMKAFVGMDTMRLSWEASSMARELGAEAVFVDETGVGGGVVDRLRELGAPVYGVQFGGRAPHPVQFGNLRSEIFWELRRLLEERLIALPNDDALAGQLLTLRYDVSSSGQVKLESKKAMRTKGLPSPDLADALAMAFMRPPSLQIWTGNEPFLRAARNAPAPNGVGVPVPQRPAPTGAERNGAAGDGHGADGNERATDGNGAAHNDRHSRVGGNPAPNGAERNAAAHDDRHSREGGNPAPNGAAGDGHAPAGAGSPSPYKGRGGREAAGEGTGDAPPSDAPAPPDPADVPLDRFFIRF